jgi:hypothetical protein
MKTKDMDPEFVANANGFQDADAMRQAIADAGSKKDAIDAVTDQRMLERHGELTDPQSVEAAANEAVHNEARARFLATGLKILTDSPLPANQIAKAAKEAAEGIINGKPIGEINPKGYEAAETRANKEALAAAAKKPQDAIEAQRQAILNNRLAKAAQDALDGVQKGLKYLERFQGDTTAKAVGSEYMDRINELTSAFDLSKRAITNKALAERASFRDWLDSEFERTGIRPDVDDALLETASKRHWKELSVEEFKGLLDSVKSLEHIGREQTTITLDGKRVELADMVARAKADTADMPHSEPVDVQAHLKYATGLDKISAQFLNVKSKIRGMDAAMLKMEQVFQWLNAGTRAGLGGVKDGPYMEIFRRASQAEGKERAMRADASEHLQKLAADLRGEKIKLSESLTIPELQRPNRQGQWYRGELIQAALNMGNKDNLQKLLNGYKWTGDALQRAVNTHLSASEWKYVQGIWDLVGKYGPEIDALQKRQTGRGLKMVEPQTVQTPHGEVKGGYFPIVYDTFADKNMEHKQLKNDAALFENQFARPTTSKGHTVARTGYVGPISLDSGVTARHIDQVTHDLAWREPIVDMNKFLAHKEITADVDQVMGREYRKQFRPWLQALANDKVFNTAGDSAWEHFMRTVRTNTTMVVLGFRMTTMMIHGASALSNSLGEVGPVWFAKGAAEFASPERFEKARDFMYERSPEMANRFNEHDRNIREQIDIIDQHAKSLDGSSLTQKTVDGARRFAFYGVQALDMASAAPTWMAAYLKGMAHESDGGHGMSEDKAIEYGNLAVRNAHGGGGVKDMAAVQRDKGLMSLFTMFYSFWNHMYNRQRDMAKGYANLGESFSQGTGTRDFSKLLARSWFYFAIPQIIHAYLKPDPKDMEDTMEAHLTHLAKEIGLGFVSGVPVLRDLASAAINGRDYAITPLEQAGKTLVKAAVDTSKYVKGDEVSQHAGKNAAQAAGYAVGLPTGQLSATGSFLWDVYNGDADPQGIKEWYQGVSHGRIPER